VPDIQDGAKNDAVSGKSCLTAVGQSRYVGFAVVFEAIDNAQFRPLKDGCFVLGLSIRKRGYINDQVRRGWNLPGAFAERQQLRGQPSRRHDRHDDG
jgi:hypothetical protein